MILTFLINKAFRQYLYKLHNHNPCEDQWSEQYLLLIMRRTNPWIYPTILYSYLILWKLKLHTNYQLYYNQSNIINTNKYLPVDETTIWLVNLKNCITPWLVTTTYISLAWTLNITWHLAIQTICQVHMNTHNNTHTALHLNAIGMKE